MFVPTFSSTGLTLVPLNRAVINSRLKEQCLPQWKQCWPILELVPLWSVLSPSVFLLPLFFFLSFSPFLFILSSFFSFHFLGGRGGGEGCCYFLSILRFFHLSIFICFYFSSSILPSLNKNCLSFFYLFLSFFHPSFFPADLHTFLILSCLCFLS